MPISEQMRQRRRMYIGSSDIPAILGISRFSNAADIWLSKTQTIEEEDDTVGEGSPALVGTYLEEGILEWGMDQIREVVYEGAVKVKKNQFRVKDGTNHSANCDAILSVDDIPTAVFEIKSTGDAESWGMPMTSDIPDHVNAQVQWQMYVTGLDHAWVACLMSNKFGGMTFALYTVGRDQELIDAIVPVVEVFWSDYVETNKIPEGTVPRLEAHKRVRRASDISELAEDAASEFDELCLEHGRIKAQAYEANKALAESKSLLLSLLGEAEGCESSVHVLTYAPSYRKEYTVPATEVRTFRLKEKKSGSEDE